MYLFGGYATARKHVVFSSLFLNQLLKRRFEILRRFQVVFFYFFIMHTVVVKRIYPYVIVGLEARCMVPDNEGYIRVS